MVRFLDIFKRLKPAEPDTSGTPSRQGGTETIPASGQTPQTPVQTPTPPDSSSPGGKAPYQTTQTLFRSALSGLQHSRQEGIGTPVRTDVHPGGPVAPAQVTLEDAIPKISNPQVISVSPTGLYAPEADSSAPTGPATVGPFPRPDASIGTPLTLRSEVTESRGQPTIGSPYAKAMSQGNSDASRLGGTKSGSEPLNISGVIKAQQTQETQKAIELYDRLVFFSRMLLERVDRKMSLKAINLKEITNALDDMVSLVVSGDRSLLDLTYRSSPENYLVTHLVNTTILSVELGKGIGYNPSRLSELGLASFMHDLGMQEVFPIVYSKDKLSRYEYDQVKMHVVAGANLLREIEGLPQVVVDVCYQHHERMTGDGYRKMTGQTIHEYAQIIGLADTFESITHSRPYRKQKSSQVAIKELIETAGDDFDRNALKVLVRRIGIYPVGTWVELNTGEIARVVKVSESFPIRPMVTILLTSDRTPQIEPKTIDLAKNQNVYIKTTLDEEELLAKDKSRLSN